MRPVIVKLLTLLAVFLMLLVFISMIQSLVHERRHTREQAIASIARGTAGSQTVLGPVVTQSCTLRRTRRGSDDKVEAVTYQRTYAMAPAQLDVPDGQVRLQALERGLFVAQVFHLDATMQARFDAVRLDGRPLAADERLVSCAAPDLVLAVGDARGIRTASVRINGQVQQVVAGTGMSRYGQGIRTSLGSLVQANGLLPALDVQVQLELAGTSELALVPLAGRNHVRLQSNWPHPAFGGQFLPVQREVGAEGFVAAWNVSALASSAWDSFTGQSGTCPLLDGDAGHDGLYGQAAVEAAVEEVRAAAHEEEPDATSAASMATGSSAAGHALAGMQPMRARHHTGCVQVLGVRFVDPSDPYTISHRALKYALLFVVLTFVAVGMVEVLRQLRVHPVQYLLVGAALSMFFLLLLSLGEHLSFIQSYVVASAACVLLLAYYAAYILHGWRRGVVFGAGMALLYGLLYVLLQLEQNALLAGSAGLFAVLAAVMVLTRRVDWYALGQRSSPPQPHQQDSGGEQTGRA